MNNQDTNPGYQTMQFGPMSTWKQYGFQHPLVPVLVKGKKFLQEDLGLSSMEISINSLGPYQAVPFFHRHQHNEELYLFLEGEGEFNADGMIVPVESGTAIRVSPHTKRSWRNTGNSPLYFIVIQAKEGSMASKGIDDGVPIAGAPWEPHGTAR